MIKDKSDIESYLENQIMRLITDTEKYQKVINYIKDTYNVPRSITSDYISLRNPLIEASEFMLFALFDGISKERSLDHSLSDFYTEQEINYYTKMKYEELSPKFPLNFDVIKVDDDQWIGVIDTKQLMMLRRNQIINYNENAQRTMKKIVMGDKTVYKIALNNVAIKAICNLMQKNLYIPTVITLNIPEEVDADFYYDAKEKKIIINSLDHFDILDGYHRYISICRISDLDPNFNYNMGLRIATFTDDKAKQFIHQEDQKTKMRKVDSDAMSMTRSANNVATRLNESPRCNVKGLINRNGGSINFGDLAELIHVFYFNEKQENENAAIISVTKKLTEMFNIITEYDEKYLKPYSYRQLLSIMIMFKYFDKNPEKICDVIDEVIERVNQLDNKKFFGQKPKRKTIAEIVSIIKEVEENV